MGSMDDRQADETSRDLAAEARDMEAVSDPSAGVRAAGVRAAGTGPVSISNESADSRPDLFSDRSFWGMLSTQFLGAFNDNAYKQLILLLAAAGAVGGVLEAGAAEAAGAGAGQEAGGDVQGWATLIFSIPFVLFSGFAGFLSDRFSKTPIINVCKIAEIGIMLMGLLAFYYYDTFGTTGTWIVLFLMGAQSAFFGPGKYGILPELFRSSDLPRANGLILMTTFLAIIFGTVLGGALKVLLLGEDGSTQNLWMGMLVCVGIAIIGTVTSYFVRTVPAAQPGIQLTPDALGISNDVVALFKIDRGLFTALCASSMFWLVSGIAVPTVNRLGIWMGVNELMTSVLTASIGFGIMVGALFASRLCRFGMGDRCVTIGLFGIFGCLALLGMWMHGQHVLGFAGSIVALIFMGIFAATFAIPIQVFIQERPPASLKGRMIATMNQANFVGILISGPLYQAFESLSGSIGWPISSVFWMMGLLVLPVAIFYRLDSRPIPH